ncbi:MAG: TfoX/Sxy family protein [Acidobacteria bacterium]|nr:TfoX/Sxy family protein [Acidobacteriota bacterium]
MLVSEGYLEYLLDHLEGLDSLHWKRMFGGVGLYSDEWFFGLIAGDVLYFKVDDSTRNHYEEAGSEPFRPYGQGSYSMSYWMVPAEVLEDQATLLTWARAAVEVAARKAAGGKARPASRRRRFDRP